MATYRPKVNWWDVKANKANPKLRQTVSSSLTPEDVQRILSQTLTEDRLVDYETSIGSAINPMLGSSGGGGIKMKDCDNDFSEFYIFYGFNGILAGRYSFINDISKEAVQARIEMLDSKVPYKIESQENFNIVLNMFENTPNKLEEISFEDAINTIRIGVQTVKVDDYEEPEEDEFTDNCVETCRPGEHACGK